MKKMKRERIAMEPIQNKKARKATFEGRKKSIMKKAYELSTLCGVEVCIIIYGPNNNEGQVPAQTWPQDPQDVIRIIHKYNKARIASRQPPKKYDLQDFFRDRRNKVEAERAKVDKETLRNLSSHQQNLNSLRDDELRMFVAELDARIEECDRRINMLKMMKPDHHQNNNNPRITNQNLFNVFPPTMKSAIFYPYYSPVSQNILHMQINSGPIKKNQFENEGKSSVMNYYNGGTSVQYSGLQNPPPHLRPLEFQTEDGCHSNT